MRAPPLWLHLNLITFLPISKLHSGLELQYQGFPGGKEFTSFSWQRICLQCVRPGSDPWVGEISWRREWLLMPVFWSEEFYGLYNPWSRKESDTTEQLSLSYEFSGNTVQFMAEIYIWLDCTFSNSSKKESEVAQLCPTLRPHGLQPTMHNPWDFQARVLEWVAISSSRGSYQPRD